MMEFLQALLLYVFSLTIENSEYFVSKRIQKPIIKETSK